VRDSNLHCNEYEYWVFVIDDEDFMTRDWIKELEAQQRQAKEASEQNKQDAYKRAMDIVKP